MKKHFATRLALLLALVAVPLLTNLSLARVAVQESVSELTESLKRNRDESDPKLIAQLADHRSKEAADSLVMLFDEMGSNYMRREILKGLVLFDGVAEGQQQALEKVANVATDFPDREMRMMALDMLRKAPQLGKSFLEIIVQSPAEDDVRERALKHHIAMSDESDHEWYKKLYDPKILEKEKEARDKADKKKKKKKKKGDEEEERELKLHALQSIRELAFGALAPKMEEKELIEAAEDKNGDIRSMVLDELDKRDAKKVQSLARDAFDNLQNPSRVRLAAARVLARSEGAKVARDFIDIGTKAPGVQPAALIYGLADLLVEMNDEKVNKALLKKVGKGKDYEKIFFMRATRHIEDEKLTKALRKLLKDKEPSVVAMAIDSLGKRKDAESLETFEKLLSKSKYPELTPHLIGAIGEIKGNDSEWMGRLKEYAGGDEEEIRNSAISRIGELAAKDNMDLLKGALKHEQWSTRLAALQALEAAGDPSVIGDIIARFPEETGRMAIEFSEALFRMTGQPYGKAHGGWKAWWEKEGDGFKIISKSALKKRMEEQEDRRLKQRSKASFFGIRIESHRVIFIIDVSGSMNEPLRAKYAGETSGDTRMAVAKSELQKSIDALERGALFNIIPFSGDVSRWLDDGLVGSAEQTRDEAKAFVEKLGAGGGTNLYGSIKAAFEDDQVDSIYILSDGEPTMGEVQDPQSIRSEVKSWNANRDIEIHCVAVGGSLQVLEWLAEDNGGSYVNFN